MAAGKPNKVVKVREIVLSRAMVPEYVKSLWKNHNTGANRGMRVSARW